VLWIGIVADPDPNSILMPVQIRIVPQKLIHVGKSEMNFFSQQWTLILFHLSRQRYRCHNFKNCGQYIKIFWEKVLFSFTFGYIDTDPDRQAPDDNPDPPK
jgi:hypothetical protein